MSPVHPGVVHLPRFSPSNLKKTRAVPAHRAYAFEVVRARYGFGLGLDDVQWMDRDRGAQRVDVLALRRARWLTERRPFIGLISAPPGEPASLDPGSTSLVYVCLAKIQSGSLSDDFRVNCARETMSIESA